ncbi:thioredoxin domain-containing protein [Thermohalobacter berrensis]|uniref:Thioredoxin n=1 Tax=Thermohalobacter berrensis TaxID=99594 RepID=A0A419T2U7_9FIRM|nr:thioredoxin domain-containing protein [Thermohalobacter berrensis]RKD31785.1 thioredoxin [Thermohalobacter berrensis]
MITKKKTNRLINEKSPYLLQHAHNPVDWYPWSEEAFEKAKKEDKPIFLSIGYSTCHWCHVMERESFEDEEVAKLLNENFVSIKVDREERPDIDSIYMTFCQALTGHGGWPLTIFMTPDKKPFYAGTYFPKESKFGRNGLLDILENIKEAWQNSREELIDASEKIVNSIESSIVAENKVKIDKETIHKTFEELDYLYDSVYGGFGNAPKFPIPHILSFLLRYWKVTKNNKALKMVEKTLKSMYKGGIFDHIGFGFSRYSTDRKWLVPHFEKMLYDNALLTIAYTEAYQVTKNSLYKEIAQKILTYILRDMTSPEGGFYSAEDADSEGVEGKFYVWSVEEVNGVLSEEFGELFSKYYDISKEGNFEGKNIPNLIKQDIDKIQNDDDIKNNLDILRQKLFLFREKRTHPHKDDKILTSWNGLMIAAMAIAGRVFNRLQYIDAARRAVDFIFKKLVRDDGRLLARYRDGHSAYLGYLEDYAFLIWGLIELYQATFNIEYLDKAKKLNDEMIRLFWDEKDGGFYLYGKDSEQLIVRPKEIYDGAIPSGNSVAALNMLRLAKLTKDESLREKVQIMFETFGGRVKESPNSYTHFMMALLFNNVENKEVVLAGNKGDNSTKDFIKEINNRFLPFTTVLLNDNNEKLEKIVPFVKEQKKIDDNATAYVCEKYSCIEPTTDIKSFSGILDKEINI